MIFIYLTVVKGTVNTEKKQAVFIEIVPSFTAPITKLKLYGDGSFSDNKLSALTEYLSEIPLKEKQTIRVFCNDHSIIWDYSIIKAHNIKNIATLGLNCSIEVWENFLYTLQTYQMNPENLQFEKRGLMWDSRQKLARQMAEKEGLAI